MIFFILGGLSITLSQLGDGNTYHVEHVGILAVAVEVALLALVLAYQFAQVYREKEHIERHLESTRRMAHTDALTGLPNRYALDKALEVLPGTGSLTYIDLDRLKYYNDHYGHAKGDELLCSFASNISAQISRLGLVFRVGGDEFAVACPEGDAMKIEEAVDNTILLLRQCGFDLAGASRGTAYVHEAKSISDLKHLADVRMYEDKGQKLTEGE